MVSRPPLAVLGFLASISLLVWSGNIYNIYKATLLIITVGFGNIGFNIMNEIHDYPYDILSGKDKPLVTGKVSRYEALVLMYIMFASSIVTLILLSIYDLIYLIFGIIGYIGGYIYNGIRKDIIGNIALGITYGTTALMCLFPKYLLFPLAFGLFTVGHNLMNQIQDYTYERGVVVTTPSQIGIPATIGASRLFILTSFGIYMFMFMNTMNLGLLVLALSDIVVFIAKDDYDIIELFVRKIARLFLIFGFLIILISGLL